MKRLKTAASKFRELAAKIVAANSKDAVRLSASDIKTLRRILLANNVKPTGLGRRNNVVSYAAYVICRRLIDDQLILWDDRMEDFEKRRREDMVADLAEVRTLPQSKLRAIMVKYEPLAKRARELALEAAKSGYELHMKMEPQRRTPGSGPFSVGELAENGSPVRQIDKKWKAVGHKIETLAKAVKELLLPTLIAYYKQTAPSAFKAYEQAKRD